MGGGGGNLPIGGGGQGQDPAQMTYPAPLKGGAGTPMAGSFPSAAGQLARGGGGFNPMADVDGYYGNMARNRGGGGYGPARIYVGNDPVGPAPPIGQLPRGRLDKFYGLGGGSPGQPQVAGNNKAGGAGGGGGPYQ
jgi:hypothetical protein